MLDERKRNVLFLEDDCGTREMVILTLRLSGMKVLCAKTRDEAWDLAHKYIFDLFLLDGLLPNGDSLELCRQLREFAPYTPIVFCSDLKHQADKQKGLDAGANNYLTKPFSGNLAETLFQTSVSQTPMQSSAF